MATRRAKSEDSLPPATPSLSQDVKRETKNEAFVTPLAKRENNVPPSQQSPDDEPLRVVDARDSSSRTHLENDCDAALPAPRQRSSIPTQSESDDYYAIPVFAKSKPSSSMSYDVPAVRIFRVRDDVTLAVYPLDREQLGEVWNTQDSLDEWVFERLPRAWADAERKFLPLVEYPLEYLQALLTVLRTQQFTDGAQFTNEVWKKACRRPISAITITKTCSSCNTLRQFAARTLLTAPSQFPQWVCAHFGMQCREDVDAIIYTIPPEQWQCASKSTASSLSDDALPSFPFEQHSSRPPARSVLSRKKEDEPLSSVRVVRKPEVYNVSTPPSHAHRATRENLSPRLPSTNQSRSLVAKKDSYSHLFPESKHRPPDLDSLSDRDSDHSDYRSHKPVYLTWTQIPSEKRLINERSSAIVGSRGSAALRRATPSHFMVGDPLIHMNERDPTASQVREFSKWMHSSIWREQRKDLDKWVGTRKSALFEAKGTPLEITNWDSMLNIFFADNAIFNPIIQAKLATQTFRGTAANWWRAHSMLFPELVVSYEQLLEWIRSELVPLADPATAVLAWRQLRFLGDVDDYLKQLDQLSMHFPLPHETLLAMATEPLGREALSSVYKADQMHGPTGMPYTRLRKFIQAHLHELTPSARKHLADTPPVAQGYGKTTPDRDKRMTNTNTAFRRGAQTHAFDLDAREQSPQHDTERPSRRIGRGSNPCWICGADTHGWKTCHRFKKGKCACCGSEAHLTRDCAQRYYPDPRAPRLNYVPSSSFSAGNAYCSFDSSRK